MAIPPPHDPAFQGWLDRWEPGMSKLGKRLIQSAKEGIEIVRGNNLAGKVYVPKFHETIDHRKQGRAMTLKITESQRKELITVVSLAIDDHAANRMPCRVLENILEKLRRL